MSQTKPQSSIDIVLARKIAHVMDDYKLDPIMGFVLPGIGDFLGGFVSLSLVGIAIKRKVGSLTIARMLMNVAIDVGLGAVPLFGDLFDLWFRANSRNADLLERAHARPEHRWRDALVLVLAALVCLAAIGLSMWVAFLSVRWLWHTVATSQFAQMPSAAPALQQP